MSDADRAYELAKAKIAEAKRTGATELSFFGEAFRALDRLPPEIGDLTGLQILNLSNTQITDLAPLAGLTGLQSLNLNSTMIADVTPLEKLKGLRFLWLTHTRIADVAPLAKLTAMQLLFLNETLITDIAPLISMTDILVINVADTQVTDLRPIAMMNKLGTQGVIGHMGGAMIVSEPLRFQNTPATTRDKRLAELAQIKNHEERSRETLAYLRSLPPWPEPYTPEATPDGSLPQPIGEQTSSPKQFAPLTLEAILTAQTPLGWRFSPDHGTMILYVEEQPLTAFQEQFAKMTADRLGSLLKLVGNANFGIRGDLRDEAERFDALLKDESRSLSLRSLELWGSLVALGSLLDANDDARRSGQDPIDLMTPQQRASLQTLLQVAGNLVRSFPDVQKLDESAGGFLRKEVTLEIVAQLIDTAISTRFVDLQSAALMQHVKEVADSPGKQADKAASATTRGASNMALTAAMIVSAPFAIAATGIVAGAAEQVGSEIAIEYQLGQRAISFIEAGRESLSALIENLPPDEAAQLRATLQDAQEKIAQQSEGEE